MSSQPLIPNGPSVHPQPGAGSAVARPALTPASPTHTAATSSGVIKPLLSTGGSPGGPASSSVVNLSPESMAEPMARAAPAALRLAWPSTGLGAQPLRQAVQLLQAMALTARTMPKPLMPLAAQAWSPAFLAQWLADRDASPDRSPLSTFATQHVQVHTPAGQQSLFMRLLLPAGHLSTQVPAERPANAPAAAAPRVVRWPDSPLLGAGALAWLLAPEGEAVLSALLVLEWGPRREAVVYGKGALQNPHDPWLLQAQLLAMGVKEKPHPPAEETALCDTPDCPYRGQAVCPQPFCPATGAVAAVASA